ncbi:MAG: hypothetical protein P8X70_02005 [Nanoarchaeota archaeon]
MNNKKCAVLFVFGLILAGSIFLVSADEFMNVEARFEGFGAETIQINVPDYIFLGNITLQDPSYETKYGDVYVENTGTEDVIVTPELLPNAEEVFEYISFRNHKTENETDVPFTGINDWNISVDSQETEKFYISLDLSDFEGTLESDEVTLNTTIKFVAMAI